MAEKRPKTKTPSVKLDGKGGKVPSVEPPKTPPTQKITPVPRRAPAPTPPQITARRPVPVRPVGTPELPKLNMPVQKGPTALPQGLPKSIELSGPKPQPPKMIPARTTGPINLESTTKTYRDKLITPDNSPKLKNPASQGKLIRTGGAQAVRAAHVPPMPATAAPNPAPKQLPAPSPQSVKPPAMPAAAEGAKVAETAAKATKAGKLARAGGALLRVGAFAAKTAAVEGILPAVVVGAGFQAAAKLTVDAAHHDAGKQLKDKYGIYAKRPKLTFRDAGAWFTMDDKRIPASDPNKIKFFDAEGNDLEKVDPFKGPPKKKKEATK